MTDKKYFVVSKDNNIITNIINLKESDKSLFLKNLKNNYFLVEETESELYSNYNSPDGSCQYFKDQGIFQPVEPESNTWTKNSDGIWNEILERPNANSFWSLSENKWVDCTENIKNNIEDLY